MKARIPNQGGQANLMKRILPPEERSVEKINELLDIFLGYYKEHYLDKTVIYEGIIPLLKALKAQGIIVGVVSKGAGASEPIGISEKIHKLHSFIIMYLKEL